MKRFLRGAAIVAVSALSSIGLVTQASAATSTFSDPAPGITTVKVYHSSSIVKVKVNVGAYELGSDFKFWLDTDPSNPGPEYRTTVYPNSDGITLRSVDDFGQSGSEVACSNFHASADAFDSSYVSIWVPRGCIGSPSKVRVSTRASFEVPGPNKVDWAPGKNAFYGWVNSN